jgi:alpha-2-macroglobulin
MTTSRLLARQAIFPAVLAVSLWLGGCDRNAPQAKPEPIKADAIQVQSGFFIAELRSTAVDDAPAIELSLSEALASEQDFNAVIAVQNSEGKKIDGGWSLDYNDPRVLRFSPVEAGKDYQVTVSKELLSKSGAQFSADVVQKLTGVQMVPSLGFSGQGSLLPSRATEGLPIRTVNISEVDVEFLRVKDIHVAEAIRERAVRGGQSGWSLNRISRIADSVYQNRFQITDQSQNKQVVSFLPVQTINELKQAGLYYAIMRKPNDFDSQYEVTHYVVSDIGVQVRRYGSQSLVLTRSLSSGQALANVNLSVISPQGQMILKGASDGTGQALLDLKPTSEMVLLAQVAGELSVLPFNQPALDLSEFDIAGGTTDEVSLHIWSGRDLYRPGETLKAHALLRDFDGKSIADQTVFGNLLTPEGKIYATQSLKPAKLGYLEFVHALPNDAPTGKWRLELSTDPEGKGPKHRFEFRVEEFLPERMKLELASAQTVLSPADSLKLDITGAYLYGAPASGNRFKAKYMLSANKDAVPALKGYIFGDQINTPKAEAIDVIDEVLSADGKLTKDITFDAKLVNGPLNIAVVGELFETGGRAVTRAMVKPIWPSKVLVGVRPMFEDGDAGYDSNAIFELARVDVDGKDQAGKVEVKFIRENRDYRWSYRSGLGWVSDYTETLSDLSTQTVQLDGKSRTKVESKVQWGNYRIEVKDIETNLVTRYTFHAGWGWDNDNTGPDARPDKVKLALDKAAYKVGDTVRLTVTPPEDGQGVLLVETGKLLQTREFVAGKDAVVELKVLPEWDRHDVYLTALVFKPGDQSNGITPKRAVGMIHLPMDRTSRRVELKLTAPEKMVPNQNLVVGIDAPQLKGKTAQVFVHAVDQGITNITQFSVPDPFKYFFAQRAFSVDVFDVYGRIIEILPGSLAKLRFGGDAMLGSLQQAKRDTAEVQTVDLFSGAVDIDANGKAQISLSVPDFNGSLKVSAIAFDDQRYGMSAQETIVRAPIVVEVSMPRTFAPGDQGKLTVDVQNFTDKPGDFALKLFTSDGLSFSDRDAKLSLQNLEKQTVSFDVNANSAIGIAKYQVQVEGNGVKFERKFETVVRPAWNETRKVRFEQVSGPGQIDLNVGTSEFYPSTVRSRVALSVRAPLPVADAVRDLYDYPYGCIEQTTSKLLPYIALDDAALAKLGLPASTVKNRAQNINFALGRIASMQAPSGHFNYWPGGDYTEPTITPFVAEVLVDAKAQGHAMAPNMVQNALERLKESLLSGGELNYDRVYGDNGDHLRLSYLAHAAYVLSKVNQAPLGSLRSIADAQAKNSLSPLPLVRLAVALKSAGDLKRANDLIQKAFGEKWKMTDRWLGDYGSELRDQSLALALAVESGLLPKNLDELLLEVAFVARDRMAGGYLSTQERVAVIRLAKDLALSGSTSLNVSLIRAGKAESITTSGSFAANLLGKELGDTGLSFDAKNAYLLQQTVGIPRTAPSPSSEQISVRRQYFNLDGTTFSGNQIREGDQLVVKLTVESKVWANDFLLVDLLPGGFEAENLNLLPPEQLGGLKAGDVNVAEARSQAYLRFEEFRDDRYVLATNLQEGEVNFYYVVRAVSPGNYVVPPTFIEDMYRPALSTVGISIPERITVLEGQ